MKQAYIKPEMRVVELQHQGIICTSANRAVNNVGIKEEIRGGSGTARSRHSNSWDDDDDE